MNQADGEQQLRKALTDLNTIIDNAIPHALRGEQAAADTALRAIGLQAQLLGIR